MVCYQVPSFPSTAVHQLPLDITVCSRALRHAALDVLVYPEVYTGQFAATMDEFRTSADLLKWLAHWPTVASQLKLICVALTRKQLHGAHVCAKGMVELLRTMVGTCKFQSTYHLLAAVRAVAREVQATAPSEFTIGNIARRVLFMVREEYSHTAQPNAASEKTALSSANFPPPPPLLRTPSGSSGGAGGGGSGANAPHSPVSADLLSRRLSMSSLALPSLERSTSGGSVAEAIPPSTSASATVKAAKAVTEVVTVTEEAEDQYFQGPFADIKQAVMAAIIELAEELDNLVGPVCEQAQEHIHNDECVLVYGHSPLLEAFLKAAARKRRFQVVIAEGGPSLDGHKLAASLPKATNNNIAVTLVPDSGIYALMARVNKVLLCPHAVVADGGALCSTGHLMVAVAAREFSVPVVGVAGTFTLTPLFAHNQREALGELLSPAAVLAYDALDPAAFGATEVAAPAFDVLPPDLLALSPTALPPLIFILSPYPTSQVAAPAFDVLPPDLLALYVTNNGSHQPSYMYRLLAEYYHPHDHHL